jgi:DNA-binding IclR family transcriptional regulator
LELYSNRIAIDMTVLISAANVFRLFASAERDLSVTDVAEGLSLPKSSASRLLRQMLECGMLERCADSLLYRPALLLLEVAHQVRATTPLLARMEQELENLVGESGHTGYISVLDQPGASVVVLRVHRGSHPLQVVTWPGHKSAAIATSTGRALLARLDDATVASHFDQLVAKAAPSSPRDLTSLRNRLEQIRRDGWAAAQDEALPGVGSVSCAVADPLGKETMAFCLSFPSRQIPPVDAEALARGLADRARKIGRAIGDPFWSR